MYMVMYVSRDITQAEEMLEHWVKAGISGVTILESSGMSQAAQRGFRDDIRLMFSLSTLTQAQEIHHRTLFSAIKDEATVQRVVEVSTAYVGDWSRMDAGVLFVWPLTQAYGLEKKP
ncbi:MAG: hypothetical protein HXY40_08670 [Chloroflexi bacterium]|nr:hypothetical protein [Chloroflexota bacterium]